MKNNFSPKNEMKRALLALESADNILHEISFQLDLEYGPNRSSDLAVALASIQRKVDEAQREAGDLLDRAKGKLPLNFKRA